VSWTIWKYELTTVDQLWHQNKVSISMPWGARLLHVGVQNDVLCVWAMIDTLREAESRSILICRTGNPCPADERRYVGSVEIGLCIWHVFDGEGYVETR
jgi:hypothetical protein